MRIYLYKDLAVPFQCPRKTSIYTINRLTWQRGPRPSLRGNWSAFGLVLCKNAGELTAICHADVVFDGKPLFGYPKK
jgi:hypothetical protein